MYAPNLTAPMEYSCNTTYQKRVCQTPRHLESGIHCFFKEIEYTIIESQRVASVSEIVQHLLTLGESEVCRRDPNVAPTLASMSNRDSMGFGDLIPQDVADVFAQERMSKGARRKKRSKSLGRAFGWLKGKKRKDADANGQRLGLGPGLDLALDGHPAGPQAASKQAGKQGYSPGISRVATPVTCAGNFSAHGRKPHPFLSLLHMKGESWYFQLMLLPSWGFPVLRLLPRSQLNIEAASTIAPTPAFPQLATPPS
ncbi:hypothetical protein N1851_005318 [Merluccius polli]|uniref:Uncharacterized protein n=1 Tax=Merluccius polli TaxID=89951 RepID=A0AA47N737_MERPO|nr:hypothetical protein N1851_005318 [Merluccius polli]